MKLLRKNLLLTGVFSGYFFFSTHSTTLGFMASTITELGLLLKRIAKPQWRIGYNFTAACPAAFRQQEKELQEMITKALQTWLQPLRARYQDRQFTDDFLLLKQPDVVACQEDGLPLNKLDVRITFDCKGEGLSFAAQSLGAAPDLCLRTYKEAGSHRVSSYGLVHELGHAFGLEDTYARDHLVSSGGLACTMDEQPAAIMSGIYAIASPFGLGEDDKNGIIWLYKYLHENQPAADCFFPGYVPKAEGTGDGRCQPQYPLIFEAKHGTLRTVRIILHDDPTLELNARDSQGMTALHYAVQRADREMVKTLLSQAKIKVNLLNKDRRTPAQLARHLKLVGLANLIEAHRTAKLPPWSVEAHEKLATIWGQLKQRD